MRWDEYSDIMTAKDLAKLLQVSKQAIYLNVKSGKLPHIKFGRNIRFIKDDVRRHVERRAHA